MAAEHRTGTTKAGPQTARLVACTKSKHHGFHPENEECPSCDPPKPTATVDPYYHWLLGMALQWHTPLRILDRPAARDIFEAKKHVQVPYAHYAALYNAAIADVGPNRYRPELCPAEYDLEAYLLDLQLQKIMARLKEKHR